MRRARGQSKCDVARQSKIKDLARAGKPAAGTYIGSQRIGVAGRRKRVLCYGVLSVCLCASSDDVVTMLWKRANNATLTPTTPTTPDHRPTTISVGPRGTKGGAANAFAA